MGQSTNLLLSFGILLSLAPAACLSDLGDNSLHPGPIQGDFAVSDYFAASGFMGDGATRGRLTMKRDDDCKPRSEGAQGSCFHFTYNAGDEGWAGVFFQYPANSWGASPGRTVKDNYSRVRFEASAEYKIVPPSGAGVGDGCAATSACRPGLACEGGTCSPAATRTQSQGCLISAECADELQCAAQICASAGAGVEGSACEDGRDASCARGLRCGEERVCVRDGRKDVGEACSTRNDCFAGLYCSQGECLPRTELGPFQFKVGGIEDDPQKGFLYGDVIGPEFPGTLGPDTKAFDFDISRQFSIYYFDDPENLPEHRFDSLIGGFMWAVAFPNIDEIRDGPVAYKASLEHPVHIYFDNIRFITDASFQAEQGLGGAGP